MTPEQRVVEAIRSWPNHPWLVLPGPIDIAGGLAAHLVKELGLTVETNAHYGDRYSDDSPATRWHLVGAWRDM